MNKQPKPVIVEEETAQPAPPHPSAPANQELALVQLAIERGMGADEMGKIVAMAEKFAANRAREAFEVAMACVQAEIPNVLKRLANPQTKSRYAPLEDVTSALQPVLGVNGMRLSFSQDVCPREGWLRIKAIVGHRAGHNETHYLDLPFDGIGAKGGATAMNAVQGVGSSYAYACRYLSMRIFNMPIVGEDKDGAGGAISKEHVATINGLIEEIRSAGAAFDFEKFLAWLKVDSLVNLPLTRLELATVELKRKLNIARKGDCPV